MFSAAPTIIRSTDCRGCCSTLRCALTFLTIVVYSLVARLAPPIFHLSFRFLIFRSFLFFFCERHARRANRDEFPLLPCSARVRVFSLLVWDPPAKDLASLDVDLCGSHLNPAPFVFVRVADSRVFRRPLNESRFGEWLCKYEGRLWSSLDSRYIMLC